VSEHVTPGLVGFSASRIFTYVISCLVVGHFHVGLQVLLLELFTADIAVYVGISVNPHVLHQQPVTTVRLATNSAWNFRFRRMRVLSMSSQSVDIVKFLATLITKV